MSYTAPKQLIKYLLNNQDEYSLKLINQMSKTKVVYCLETSLSRSDQPQYSSYYLLKSNPYKYKKLPIKLRTASEAAYSLEDCFTNIYHHPDQYERYVNIWEAYLDDKEIS